MTKEEALKILRKDLLSNLANYYSSEELQDAIDTIVSQPFLPSDLDEAAEKNFETIEVLEHENIFEETHRKIFKAGVEWMAGQGVKIGETEIYLEDDGGEPPYDGTSWFELTGTEYPIPKDKFKDGDKVDIILRKKQ